MSNPEIKVGQKYRVVDAEGFGYHCVIEGEILQVHELNPLGLGVTSGEMLITPYEITQGVVELIEDALEPTEYSKDDSPAWATSVPETVKTHAQVSTEAPESIQSGLSAELLWKFIEGSSGYNGHKQSEVDELHWGVLKDAVKMLGEYLEDYGDTPATSLEIRLMYNGSLSGKFKHTWGASVYQLDYWKDGEHNCGHRDRLLFGVEIVKGI